MCNICAMVNAGGITKEMRDLAFDIQVIAGTKHSDGFGYFTPEVFHKSPYEACITAYSGEQRGSWGHEFLVTHTRKSSSGKQIKPANGDNEGWGAYFTEKKKFAHPFIYENISLIHNGTLVPNNSAECDMDSRFFAEKLNSAYDVEKRNYVEALEEAFSHFKNGIYSMVIGFKTSEGYIPLILKGTKPLTHYLCKCCGTSLYVTDTDFSDIPLLLLETKTEHRFRKQPILTPGLYNPFTGEELHSGLFLQVTPQYTTPYNWKTPKERAIIVTDNSSPEMKLRALYTSLGTKEFGLQLHTFFDNLTMEDMEKLLRKNGKDFVDELEKNFKGEEK